VPESEPDAYAFAQLPPYAALSAAVAEYDHRQFAEPAHRADAAA
jgi:hypothetical protein